MNDVRWEGFTHEEIYARVQAGPGRAASADAETAWATVAQTIRDVDAQLTRAAEQIGIGWQGAAAANVRGGLTVMSNWALDAAGDAELTRTGITAQADAAAHVRAAMPPPRPPQWTEAAGPTAADAGLVLGVPNIGVLEDRDADDRAVAVELMNRYTSDSSTNTRMMDYWTPPPSIVVETVAPTGAAAAVGATAAVLAPAALVPRAGARPAGPTSASGPVPPGVAASGVAPSAAGPGPAAAEPAGGVARDGATIPGSTPPPATALPSPPLPGGVRPVVPGQPPRPAPLPGDGSPTRSADPGRAGAGPSLPRTLPEQPGRPVPAPLPAEPSPGVPGAPTRPVPGGGAPEGGSVLREPAGAPNARGGTGPGTGLLPFGGMPLGTSGDDHRRPDYLVDDTDAFADDRWCTPAVLAAGDGDDR